MTRPKPTKVTTAKRKPAAKSPRRTKIGTAMKTHEALVDIGGRRIPGTDISDLRFDEAEPVNGEGVDTNLKPITLEGTFDDAAFPFPWTMEPQKQLTIVASRRFLWWEVSRQRIRQNVTLQPHTVTQAPDGAITYSVPMKCDGPYETILSSWWERALYAVARIWS